MQAVFAKRSVRIIDGGFSDGTRHSARTFT